MQELSTRQQQCLDFIRDYQTEQGVPPTIREIADAMQIKSPNGVVVHLKALRAKGYLKWRPSMSRGIRLLEPSHAGDDLLVLKVSDALRTRLAEAARSRGQFVSQYCVSILERAVS